MNSSAGARWQNVTGNAAEVYATYLAPGMFAPWAAPLVERVGVQRGDAALDVACGTGVVARELAQRVGAAGRVMGLDFNAGMLAAAQAHAATTGVPIEWLPADALAMPLPDAVFDVVVCQHGLQQMPDPAAVLLEMRRVLRPGGRLGLCVWSDLAGSPGMQALVQALERHVSVAAANNRRAPFALSDGAALVELVRGAGFIAVELHTIARPTGFPSPEALVDAQLAATPLATLGEISAKTRAAIRADVRAALHAYLQDDAFSVPMEAHIVIARCPE